MHVLVVEDNPRTAEVLGRGLREEHWVVDVVTTGREALRWGRTLPYDVIVLDIRLPDISGHDVCRQLRQRGVWTPILMLTALGTVGAGDGTGRGSR
ncbi:two-component system, OmpR family, response regulator [Raineyella antarctica]|uniref:Two-component system, OmpR family, response regulator n=1 Tax=Raineyella antarctica TaxID=1577474 RepID=A0A1G6HKG7_9ACTN|nr:response regulator [Raineyella antarctica]SDB94405.1 two-component system, OmpR family, response regulator [Raineyella antarctica]